MYNNLSNLLEHEMTRKQFLFSFGFILLTVSGIAGIYKRFSNPNLLRLHPNTFPNKQNQTAGYGKSKYGV